MMILRKYFINNIIKYMKYLIIIFSLLINSLSISKDIYFKDLLKKDGIFYEKFSNTPFTGKITGLLEGTFKKGMKYGEFIKYYSDGKVLSKISYFENRLDGSWKEYYRNGNLLRKKTFKDDLLEGEYIDFYSFGQILSKRFYVKNKLEGIYKEFYKNGQLHIKKNYKNNILEGEYIVYHEYEFEPVVQIKSKKYYKNGKIEGKFVEFDENGNKIKEGFYKEGKLEGTILNYNKLGKVLSKLIYEDGLLIDASPYQ